MEEVILSKNTHVFASSPEWILGTIGNVIVAILRGSANVSKHHELLGELKHAMACHHGNCGLLMVVEPTSPTPDAETRRASRRVLQLLQRGLRCIAVVFEGEGVRTIAQRLIISGLFSSSEAQQSFQSIGEGQAWMEGMLADMPPTLAEDVEYLRAAIPSLRQPRRADGRRIEERPAAVLPVRPIAPMLMLHARANSRGCR